MTFAPLLAARRAARWATLCLAFACAGAASAQISTVAGNGAEASSGDGGPVLSAGFYTPGALAIDSHGNLYVAETESGKVRKIATDGTVSHFAGVPNESLYGDGGPATQASLYQPTSIAVDASDNVYIADAGHHRIRKVNASGVISTVAGSGPGDGDSAGFDGDGGQATSALLSFPTAIAFDGAGNLLIADRNNHRIRQVTPAGIISTIAGNGGTSGGVDGAALDIGLGGVESLAVDASGNVLFVENVALQGQLASRVRMLSTAGQVSTIAGTGAPGYAGDGGPAAAAQFCAINGIALHPDGSLFVSDGCNHRIRRIAGGSIVPSAGTGAPGFAGDGGSAFGAQLSYPAGIAVDASGRVFFVDAGNVRVRSYLPEPVTPPGAPVIEVVYRGNGEALVSFSAPASNGGFPITGYTVASIPGGGVDTQAGSLELQHLVTNLANGTSYTFVVTATSAIGTSDASAPSSAIVPAGVPGRPVVETVAVASGQASVSFSPPASAGDSPITGYVVSSLPAGGVDESAGSTATTHVITGLQNGSSYRFVVVASNAVGSGLPSEASAPRVVGAVPGAPGQVSATAAIGSAVVSFATPTELGNFPITGYVVTSSPAGGVDADAGSASLQHTVNGLAAGTSYTFTVHAVTDSGPGAESAPSNAITTPNVPDAPASVVAEAGDGTATVTITPPPSDGGLPITGYYVTAPNGGVDQDAGKLVLVHRISGLVNGTSYVFSAAAENDVGLGSARAAAAVTPTGSTLSISDVSITEGNSLTKTATFTITLSKARSTAVTFTAATANGTATAGSDYVAKTLTGQRIAAGATSRTFTVTINGDTTPEPDETFVVNLSNAVGATIADGQATGTISNDDAVATPTLSIADASVTEGNTGTKTLSFTVSLSAAASGTVSYNIATSNGTATAGSDYVASSLTGQTIAAGTTSKTFAVTINGDTTNEPNETFNVTLTNVTGATLGDGAAVGTITNDDGTTGGPSLSIADVTLAEGNSLTKQMTFTVKLSAPATSKVTYDIATANGTAIAGSDYTAKTLSSQAILAGATSKTFVVVIRGDTVPEANETFTVNLSKASGATVADGQAIGTISNDDGATLTMARVDAGGLFDDIDDGKREPVLGKGDYATLLLDTAMRLCARSNAATVVGVDQVEHLAALSDLADAANAACAGKARYQAVMGKTGETGFLVEQGVAVEAPLRDANGMVSLRLQPAGASAPITLVLSPALSADASARAAQLRAIGQSARAMLGAEASSRVVLIGGITVPGYTDLTARTQPALPRLPAERVLASPALLQEFAEARVAFPAVPANDSPAQVLELRMTSPAATR